MTEREMLTWDSVGVAGRDLVWRRTDRWINVPWPAEPPVTLRSGVLDA